MLLGLLWLVTLVALAEAGCSWQGDPGLHVTERLTCDYARVEQYKELTCPIKGFNNITWCHSGGAVFTSSTFDRKPSEPRVLYTKYLRAGDAGNYTCTASNSTHVVSHTVNLTVFTEQQYNGPPLLASGPLDQWAEVGESAEFKCSVFVGFGRERQLNSQVYWIRDKWKFAEFQRYENSSEGAIFSAIINIPHVEERHFGRYLCVGNNGASSELHLPAVLHKGRDPHARVIRSPTMALAILAGVLLTGLALGTTYLARRTEIHLFLKDRLAPLEDQGESRHDVFICYSPVDSSQLVHQWIVPQLEQHFGYSCFAFERDIFGGEWLPDVFLEHIRQSRRFLLILSPGALRDPMCGLACQFAVQEALGPHSIRLVCAWPPRPTREELLDNTQVGEAMRLVLAVSSKATLPPTENSTPAQRRRFWSELRLRLPPRRPEPKVEVYRPLTTPL